MYYVTPQDCGCPLIDGPGLSGSPICNGTMLFLTVVHTLLKGRCDISTPCTTVKPVEKTHDEYDFIVVGGGTAGAVVASRLSEEKGFKVLLMEAGGPEPIANRPPGFYRSYWDHSEVDWLYRTVPSEDYCLDQGDKGCKWPRGKVLGGSCIFNGMMYHRGHTADYEDWVNAGAKGWSWEENLPYFDMSEGNKEIGSVVSAEYHSDNGTMPVQRFNYQPPFLFELINSIKASGVPVVQDMNDPNTPEGFGIAQAFNKDGQRYTSARAYLKKRPNLHVILKAHVSKVLTKTVKGKIMATGVQYYDKNGKLKTVHATKEVILSAGALNSPQILMLSGIGPKKVLKKFKIPIVKALPVGENLINHIGMTFNYLLTKVENTQTMDWTAVTEYMLNRGGPMSSTGLTQLTGILFSSLADRSRNQPDLQFFFNGYYAECSSTGVIGEKVGDCYERGTNISVNVVGLLPKSVGYVTLNSTDPFDAPLFYPNYFSHPDDMAMLKDGARVVQNIFDTDLMKDKYGVELDPAYYTETCADIETWSDDWIECTARFYTDPQNHQQGTAAIGLVIDTHLRVYGIPNLRVIDASSMPTLLTGNPEGAILMVAERGADFIKKTWM